tara:strand:+ start:9 stop:371 length:363 start_codon:yes stop_codon:yes gene_type:complete
LEGEYYIMGNIRSNANGWSREKKVEDIMKRREKVGGVKQWEKENGQVKNDMFMTPSKQKNKKTWMPHIEKGAEANGKGDGRRKQYVTDEEYRDRHDLAFGKITEKEFKRRENARRKSSNS